MLWRRQSIRIQISTGRSLRINIISPANLPLILSQWTIQISSSPVLSKKLLEGRWSAFSVLISYFLEMLFSRPLTLIFLWFQQGHCWSIRESHCFHSSWSLPRCTWDWCVWSQIQHCVPWCWYEHILPLHRGEKEVEAFPSRDWRPSLQQSWEWRTLVSAPHQKVYLHVILAQLIGQLN